ncbi:single-stranded DNA-binding protein [Mycoplasma sp. U97]|uniref:single-stranded DNA-binding protein n=1 Tax=Mycoplasma tauri TaxID=547987 RepID=UPI001CBDB9BD|nr:single-stranded DNA-binding protein [Mycoplasma tauri]MBZ4212580.1 single-stranded DNA-binding protein [Mycoplasma tauri]
MNKVLLVGWIASDIKLDKTKSNVKYARCSIALRKPGLNDYVDYISLVAWDKIAEYMQKNIKKGSLVSLEGTLSTNQYKIDEKIVKQTNVVVKSINLLINNRSNDNPSVNDKNEFDLEQDIILIED